MASTRFEPIVIYFRRLSYQLGYLDEVHLLQM